MSGRLSPEVSLFARMAAFGLVVGAGYWLLTGESAGTVMLEAFGIASLIAAVAVFVGLRAGARGLPGAASAASAAAASAAAGRAPGGGEPEPPRPGWAPLLVALGLGGVALGLAFGPWLSVAGVLVAVRSAKAWLDATVEEASSRDG